MVGEFSGSCGIGDVAGGMLAAVDLDRQFPCRTCEICDTLSDRMLAAELPGATSGPQGMPQALFGIGGIAAQTAGRVGRSSHWYQPPTSPRPSPPPGAEREFTPALDRMGESNALAALGGGEGQGEVGDSFRVAMQVACGGGRSSHWYQPSPPRGADREFTLALVPVCGCRAPHA
jgi:hypothetical protein